MSAFPLAPEQILEKALESEMISVEQLHHLLQARPPRVVLLDVRTAQEHRLGVIPGSRMLPCDHDLDNLENMAIFSDSFRERFRPEQFDPADRHILVCRTGPRTAVALAAFLQHDLPACEVLGGITEWQRKGLPLQLPDS
ncbi:MAG: hypothetical protein HQL88_05000 [Magnetococcales bacterium]|nr:hypothetical protein [Magnetococcales bacterium]